MKKIITLIITLALLTACAGNQPQPTSKIVPTLPSEQRHDVKHAEVLSPAKTGVKAETAAKDGSAAKAGAVAKVGSAIFNLFGTVFLVTGDIVTGHPVAAVLDAVQ